MTDHTHHEHTGTAHGTASAGAHAAVRAPRTGLAALTVGAAGIVFGAIGTSPLYAVDQLFSGDSRVLATPDNVLGVMSLIVWAMTLVVSVKYAVFVLRADNDGEGGMFALYGLLHPYRRRGITIYLWLLVLGAGLLFGDGIITPAISILSAVEGLGVARPALEPAVIPITLGLLTVLFAVQARGTTGIGRIFGPVLILWFIAIALLGLRQITHEPRILEALDPRLGLSFLHHSGAYGTLIVLGALVLVVTGSEAMYADLGHFGARPIRTGWFVIVCPALLLNYLGQGAYLLSGAAVRGDKLFFTLVPQALLYPVVLLATLATVIAAQALISGVFSLTSQAIALGLSPRLTIRHTHHAHAGQLYVPFINWSLYAGCVVLVLGFRSSAALAAAYGLAVSGVMVITSSAMVPVTRLCWSWGRLATSALWLPLTALNLAFLLASSFKFLDGGFVPLGVGVALFVAMETWRWGRKATFAAYSAKATMTVAELVDIHRGAEHHLARTAVLMAAKPMRSASDRTPALLQLLWDRYGILPLNLVFVEVMHRKVPYIHDNRYAVTVFDRTPGRGSIIGVELSFGFMEEPNVERALEGLARHQEIDLPADRRRWIVHVTHENLLPSRSMGVLGRIRFRLFLLLRLVSRPTYYAYGLGDEVQLSAEIIPVRVH